MIFRVAKVENHDFKENFNVFKKTKLKLLNCS